MQAYAQPRSYRKHIGGFKLNVLRIKQGFMFAMEQLSLLSFHVGTVPKYLHYLFYKLNISNDLDKHIP